MRSCGYVRGSFVGRETHKLSAASSRYRQSYDLAATGNDRVVQVADVVDANLATATDDFSAVVDPLHGVVSVSLTIEIVART